MTDAPAPSPDKSEKILRIVPLVSLAVTALAFSLYVLSYPVVVAASCASKIAPSGPPDKAILFGTGACLVAGLLVFALPRKRYIGIFCSVVGVLCAAAIVIMVGLSLHNLRSCPWLNLDDVVISLAVLAHAGVLAIFAVLVLLFTVVRRALRSRATNAQNSAR